MRDAERFVHANTAVATAPLVPEIRLHLATEVTPLWQATESELARTGLEPPFVGRDDELRLLKDLVSVTGRDRRTRLVSITGPGSQCGGRRR